jgi:hypothetical protein
MGQPNPQKSVPSPKTETTRRALLQNGDLMPESQDLSLLSGTGPKRRSDQSQKTDEKWSHRGDDDDLINGESLHFQSGRRFRYPPPGPRAAPVNEDDHGIFSRLQILLV